MSRYPRRALRGAAFAAIITTLAVHAGSAAQTTRAGRNFLWKVQSAAGVLYLAGSVHALSADVYPLNDAYQRAFDASDVLVEEIDLAEADALSAGPMLLTKGFYMDGRTLDQAVSKETLALVTDRLKSTPLGVGMVQSMKPWMVMLMLTALEVQQAGLDAKLGLDTYFFDKAKAAGKPVIALETIESQMDRFDRMPDAVQDQLLRSTLTELNDARKELAAIITAWQQGDASTLEKMLLDGFVKYPAVYDSIIVERNRNWLPQLEKCLARTRPCFVVVGAAHLVGPDGLLGMLRQKGYRLEQQ